MEIDLQFSHKSSLQILPAPFEQFKDFLNNFGNWNKYLGIEEHKFVQNCSKNFLLRNYLSNYVFKKQLNLWEYFNSYRKNRKFLNTPRHGNQIGAFIDNKYFTTLASFSNEIIANNLLEIIKVWIDEGATSFSCIPGDYNLDSILNVLDVVGLVSCIVDDNCDLVDCVIGDEVHITVGTKLTLERISK